jgi:hypothetical protein
MKRPALFLMLPVLAATFGTVGCDKSPTAPEVTPAPPPPMTPIQATITRIDVTKFPGSKSDGNTWDASVIASARRPDLYVVVAPTSGADDFVSITVQDAQTGQVHAFTRGVTGALPANIPYGSSRRVYVMDEDFGGDDDRVGWITLNLPRAYKGDNARDFDHTYTDSGDRLSVRVYGTWGY